MEKPEVRRVGIATIVAIVVGLGLVELQSPTAAEEPPVTVAPGIDPALDPCAADPAAPTTLPGETTTTTTTLPGETTTTTLPCPVPTTPPPTDPATTVAPTQPPDTVPTTTLPTTTLPATTLPTTSLPSTTLPDTSTTTSRPPRSTTTVPLPGTSTTSTVESTTTVAAAAVSTTTSVTTSTSSTTTTPTVPPAPPPAAPPIDPEPGLPVLPSTPPEGWPSRPIDFPVAGPVVYFDDWGACRGGASCPRRHVGNDLLGFRLQPLLAAADGTVTHLVLNHPTAGWGFVITDAEGWEYRYYHVNNDSPGTDDGTNPVEWRLAPGIAEGSPVRAGQVVGYMGDSGNSEFSTPHLHFEIRLPNGQAINPYDSLRVAERARRCAGGLDPDADALLPVPAPATADVEMTTRTGGGTFLLGTDGSVFPLGDARTAGWSRHAAQDPPCPD